MNMQINPVSAVTQLRASVFYFKLDEKPIV